jgi:hypothetical protein
MPKPPGLFLSYARIDNEDGRLSELLAKLQLEVRQQTGGNFVVFQDSQSILWGQAWRSRIQEGLDESTFLLPILTPSFFASEACRAEVERFVENERQMERDDLLLPIYYIEYAPLSRGGDGSADEIIEAMTSHQYVDWRELRHEPLTLPTMSRRIADLGTQIRDAIERVAPSGGEQRGPASESSASAPAAISKPNEGKWFARPEPPTHIVDYTGRGEFLTIADAIKHAAPGDRIVVRQGIYREGLSVTKPLEIIGAGERHDTVIEARDADVVLFAASWGRLANLTLDRRPSSMGSTSPRDAWMSRTVTSRADRGPASAFITKPTLTFAGIASAVARRPECSSTPRGAERSRTTRSAGMPQVASWSRAGAIRRSAPTASVTASRAVSTSTTGGVARSRTTFCRETPARRSQSTRAPSRRWDRTRGPEIHAEPRAGGNAARAETVSR